MGVPALPFTGVLEIKTLQVWWVSGRLETLWEETSTQMWLVGCCPEGSLPLSMIIYGPAIRWTFQPFSSTAPGPVRLCDRCIYLHGYCLSSVSCSKLLNLRLDGLCLSDPIVNNLAHNTDLLWLNLSGCSGFSESALKTLLSSSSRLDELNVSWCYDLTKKHIQVVVAHMLKTITQLNFHIERICRHQMSLP